MGADRHDRVRRRSRSGDAGTAAYGAAKAGAAGFTRAIAAEVGRHGVTSNAVSLGTMRTPMTEALWASDDTDRQQAMRRYAIRRPGTPEDVAGLVTFLCSPAASWITDMGIRQRRKLVRTLSR